MEIDVPGNAPRRLGYADYAAIPDDGKRYEVLEGSLFVTPAPSPIHQRIVLRLAHQLESYFHPRVLGEVFIAPIDVILTPHDVLQPDLVVARAKQISGRGIEGAPLLAVEVLSPSTGDHDRIRKKRRYAAGGVPHFWIVDPEAHRFESYELRADVYELAPPGFPDLTIDLESLWR